jgi:hypothetical protein
VISLAQDMMAMPGMQTNIESVHAVEVQEAR